MSLLSLALACASPAPPPLPCASDVPTDGFDLPIGPPDARGYYDAQPFGTNTHLGSDWNGVGGGNTDLGDPVFATAGGVVTFAEDVGGGWGNVLRIVHRVDDATCVESLYAHLDHIDVAVGDTVRRGAPIAAIGNAHGKYWAHLHFEIRTTAGAELGGGYGAPAQFQVDPTAFIDAHRPHPNAAPSPR